MASNYINWCNNLPNKLHNFEYLGIGIYWNSLTNRIFNDKPHDDENRTCLAYLRYIRGRISSKPKNRFSLYCFRSQPRNIFLRPFAFCNLTVQRLNYQFRKTLWDFFFFSSQNLARLPHGILLFSCHSFIRHNNFFCKIWKNALHNRQ